MSYMHNKVGDLLSTCGVEMKPSRRALPYIVCPDRCGFLRVFKLLMKREGTP